jgi:type 1 fimbriae regulatory protein FimB
MRKAGLADKSPHVGRDYLRPDEANAAIEAAGRVGRQRLRDQVLLRLLYRHGLRASEAKHTKWTDFDLTSGSGPKTFHVRRLKGSTDSVHTLDRDEVSALRKLKATSTSPFVFVSERGSPLSPDMIARIVERAAEVAKLGFHVHPHMLRHATGYTLANDGTDTRLIQDFLGHASIANTVRYTRLAPGRLAAVRVR